MLNFNGNQENVNPAPNNCCGGFALAAILNELNLVGNLPAPGGGNYGINAPGAPAAANQASILVYQSIQQFQVGYGGIQAAFLNDPGNITNGTKRSLPSAIIRIALNANFVGNIMLTHIANMPPPLDALVAAETATINGFNAGVAINAHGANAYPGLPPANTFRLVLCEGGGHWVACDNQAYYNPSGGANNIPNTNNFGAYGGMFIDFVNN